MHIKKSLVITYSAQIYSTIITLALTPLLISFVGAEGFGLIGFYLILQTWLQIFDAGVSGTLSRQIALAKTCKLSLKSFLSNFYKIYSFFAIISVSILLIGTYTAEAFSKHWFETSLSIDLVSFCIKSMLVSLSFKYLSGPLRSGLIGLEFHGILGIFNLLFTTLRYPAGLLILYLYDNSLKAYFSYQAIIAILEWLVLQVLFYIKSKQTMNNAKISEEPITSSIKTLLVLSTQLSILTVLWVLVSQIDKLLLSGAMSLELFGYYSLAVTVTGVIFTLNMPLNQVLMPRLTFLIANNNNKKYSELLINASLFSAVLFIPFAVFLSFFGKELVWAWTGNMKAAENASHYIIWLAIGNVAAVLVNFAFLLQFTLKNLKKHLIAYIVYSVIVIPITFLVVKNQPGEGTAIFWMLHNCLFLILWGGYTFKFYLTGYFSTVLIPAIIVISTASLAIQASFQAIIEKLNLERLELFFLLAAVGLLCVSILLLSFWLLKIHIANIVHNISLVTEK